MFALVLAIVLATPAPVNLPQPQHTCAAIIADAHLDAKAVLSADTLGALFASALRMNNVVGTNNVTLGNLVQGFSDVLGCFVRLK